MEQLTRKGVDRRSMTAAMLGGAAFVSMGALGSCSQTTDTGGVQPTVIDTIINALLPVCQVIPIIRTLVDIVASVFPAAVGVAVIADGLAKQIADYICNLFHQSGVIHEGKLAAVKGRTYKAKVADKEVELHGWSVGPDGKLAYF